jgi:hypothetical protein
MWVTIYCVPYPGSPFGKLLVTPPARTVRATRSAKIRAPARTMASGSPLSSVESSRMIAPVGTCTSWAVSSQIRLLVLLTLASTAHGEPTAEATARAQRTTTLQAWPPAAARADWERSAVRTAVVSVSWPGRSLASVDCRTTVASAAFSASVAYWTLACALYNATSRAATRASACSSGVGPALCAQAPCSGRSSRKVYGRRRATTGISGRGV